MPPRWSEVEDFSQENVEWHVRSEPGVYRLSQHDRNWEYHDFYAGQARDLRARLLQHLSSTEENECIRKRVGQGHCRFQVAYVATQAERDADERESIGRGLECNKQIP